MAQKPPGSRGTENQWVSGLNHEPIIYPLTPRCLRTCRETAGAEPALSVRVSGREGETVGLGRGESRGGWRRSGWWQQPRLRHTAPCQAVCSHFLIHMLKPPDNPSIAKA